MEYFSDSYRSAREKILQAAGTLGATVTTHVLQDDLAVDVSVIGNSSKPTLVVTSALHGIEGFFGSAVQLSLLAQLQGSDLLRDVRVVLIHALNPYGFHYLRRFDQDNIDLNRNFLKPDERYSGAPTGFSKLDGFLNPPSSPTQLELYRFKAVCNILRHGTPALKESIVSGQYVNPQGIFFGGNGPALSTRFVKTHCDEWIGDSKVVTHIDLHSGLGEFGECKILIDEAPSSDRYQWYVNTFGRESVAELNNADATAYTVTGSMGAWLQHHFNHIQYYFAGAEFGTYGPIRVLGAIRAENRAHHFSSPDNANYIAAKEELLECFCPRSEAWRESVIKTSGRIFSSAIDGLIRVNKK